MIVANQYSLSFYSAILIPMIGIFDSGIGGLTVYTRIRALAPNADIVYFGDTANAPYGNKTPAEVGALTILAVQTLLDHGATEIVSACNSVSASVARPLFEAVDMNSDVIIEMVPPTIDFFRASRKQGRILLAATQLTISSGMYQQAFEAIGIDIDVLAIPELAGAIEAGAQDADLKKIIENALSEKGMQDFDILILGCTHYPLVEHLFRESIGQDIEIYDPAIAVARRVIDQFDIQGSGIDVFIFSQENEVTKNIRKKMLVEKKK